jgi:hypothetical protein
MKRTYRKISHKYTAAITTYPSAYSTRASEAEVVELRSLRELARFLSKKPVSSREKRSVPLMIRGRVEGKRLKDNVRPPLLVIMDVDEQALPIKDCCDRLEMMGVSCVAHTTWSHGKRSGKHSYRVYVDYLADGWGELEQIARQLFELAGLEPTHESWSSPGWFVPATHPDRELKFRLEERIDEEGSSWTPEWRKPEERDDPGPASSEAADVDVDELRLALGFVPNAPRETWIEVGMALRSTGHEDARSLWDEWSSGQGYPDYDDEAQDAAWRSFSDGEGAVSVGTVYFQARQNGWRPERSSAQSDFEDLVSPRLRELRKLNDRYALVAIGQGMIADFGRLGQPIDLKSVRAFLHAHAHPRLPSGRHRADGTDVLESAGKIWLESWPRRRTYHGVDFLPPGGPQRLRGETLNLWRGWGVEPRPGGCQRYLDHVHQVICSGDDELFRWVETWMAHLYQRPWEKPETALVLRSTEGTGKGVFAGALVDLCGIHGLHVTQPSQLTGNFNNHLASKILIFADEVTWGGRRQEEGVLKGMITEKTMMLEPKGVDAFQAKSFCRVVISSNNDWVVPAGRSARRFQVIDVSDQQVGRRKEWHLPILAELRAGGLGALAHHLGQVDLEERPTVREVLKTDALRDQKLESLSPEGQWILTMLSEGRVSEFQDEWPTGPVDRADLYESYLRVAREVGIARKGVEMRVTNKLKEVLGTGLRLGRSTVEGKQRRCAWLPPLSEARAAFSEWLGSEVDWNEPPACLD